MAAIICKEPSWKTMAMGSFYNQNNVITTKLVACQIEKKKDNYFVLTSIAGDNSENSINSLYYDCNFEFGILKVSYKILIRRITLHEVYILIKIFAKKTLHHLLILKYV